MGDSMTPREKIYAAHTGVTRINPEDFAIFIRGAMRSLNRNRSAFHPKGHVIDEAEFLRLLKLTYPPKA